MRAVPAARPAAHPLALIARLVAAGAPPPDRRASRPTPTATRVHVRADTNTLGQLVQSGFYYQGVWRDIFAAARSAFAGDDPPLLRLVAETVTTDGPNGDPREFTESLYLSVICHDYPELWPAATRRSPSARPLSAPRLAAYPAGDVRALHRQGVDRP